MKKISIILLAFLALFSACELTDPLRDDLDSYEADPEAMTYTLSDDDYETLADLILYNDATASYEADFVANNKFFTDSIAASTYVPLLLNQMFIGFTVTSSLDVTVNYSEGLEEDLSIYAYAPLYELTADDYSTAGFSDAYVTTGSDISSELPDILAGAYPDTTEEGTIVVASYIVADDADDAADLLEVNKAITSFSVEDVRSEVYYDTTYFWTAISAGSSDAMLMNAYDATNAVNVANEDWLYSTFTLSGKYNKLSFENAIDYYKKGYTLVLVSEDYSDDLHAASWDTISIPQWATIADRSGVEGLYTGTFEASGMIDMSDYDGKTITLAFVYKSDVNNAPYWAVKDVEVGTYFGLSYDYFEYDGSVWNALDGVYRLTNDDYEALGSPGSYHNFSASTPAEDYLPSLLNAEFPIAVDEVSKTMVYNYYAADSGNIVLADTYTKVAGAWTHAYDYVKESTEPFKMAEDGWVFDPTVYITMASADYQLIVDYVAANIGSSYIDSYGTGDKYYGASAYYENFDAVEDGSWDMDAFATNKDAIMAALMDAYLPSAYPNATITSGGLPVYYIITYDTYVGGSYGNYTVHFEVTKDGPDPEFAIRLDEDGEEMYYEN